MRERTCDGLVVCFLDVLCICALCLCELKGKEERGVENEAKEDSGVETRKRKKKLFSLRAVCQYVRNLSEFRPAHLIYFSCVNEWQNVWYRFKWIEIIRWHTIQRWMQSEKFRFFFLFFLLLPLNLVVLEPSSVRFAISVCWFMCRCVCLRFFLGMTVVVVAVYLDFREWKIDTHVTRDGTDLLVSNGCYT